MRYRSRVNAYVCRRTVVCLHLSINLSPFPLPTPRARHLTTSACTTRLPHNSRPCFVEPATLLELQLFNLSFYFHYLFHPYSLIPPFRSCRVHSHTSFNTYRETYRTYYSRSNLSHSFRAFSAITTCLSFQTVQSPSHPLF